MDQEIDLHQLSIFSGANTLFRDNICNLTSSFTNTDLLLAFLDELHLHSCLLMAGHLHHLGWSLVCSLQGLLQIAALELELLLVSLGCVGPAFHGQDHVLRDAEFALQLLLPRVNHVVFHAEFPALFPQAGQRPCTLDWQEVKVCT